MMCSALRSTGSMNYIVVVMVRRSSDTTLDSAVSNYGWSPNEKKNSMKKFILKRMSCAIGKTDHDTREELEPGRNRVTENSRKSGKSE